MVVGFCKSGEGVKEYQKIGKPYPNNLDDEQYEEWLKNNFSRRLEQIHTS